MRDRKTRQSLALALAAWACADANAAQTPLYPVELFFGTGLEFDLVSGDFDGDSHLDVVGLDEFVVLADGAIYLHCGDGSGSFAKATKITDLLEPRSGAAADLDGDGAMDLVVAHDNSPPISTLAVLLGDGAGGFGPHVNYAAGALVTSLALADLDGDGHVDAAMANGTPSGLVSVALGNGAGAFALPTVQTCGFAPNGIALADLDADGDLDATTSDAGSNTVSILRGDGLGSFAYPTVVPVPTSPTSIAIGDVHGDGKLDVVVGRTFLPFSLAGGVSVLAGDGSGMVGPAVDWLTGEYTPAVVAAELNGDGAADVIACGGIGEGYLAAGGVRVFLSDGSGGVRQAHEYVASWSGGIDDVVAEDVDEDGDLDLILPALAVLRGDGNGRFDQPVLVESHVRATGMALADLDASGLPDLVVCGLEQTGSTVKPTTHLDVFLAEAPSAFSASISYEVGLPVNVLIAAELTGDARIDVATASSHANRVSVLAGDGAGALLAAKTHTVGSGPRDLAAGDLDRDGTTDLVTANYLADTVSVLRGTGAGSFAPSASYSSGAKGRSVELGDLDGDGDLDAVLAREVVTPGMTVMLGNGGGALGTPKLFSLHYPESVALGDVDGDGDLDAAAVHFFDDLSILLGDGLGGLGLPLPVPVEISSSFYGTDPLLRISDVDVDGHADICLPMSPNGAALVIFGTGAGQFANPRTFLAASQPAGLAAADFDGDALTDIATSGTGGAMVLCNVLPDPTNVAAFGTGSPGCFGTIGMNATTEPKVGASDFALVCANAPALVEGVCGISLAADMAGSDPLGLGLVVYLGGLAAGHVAFVPVRTDPSGFGRAELPIPSHPWLGGQTVYAQCFFPTRPESACGAAGGQLVSSVGLALAFQP